MTLLVKQIKPSKLSIDQVRLELLNELRKQGTKVKADFEKTVATWKKKPKFQVLISLKQPGPTLLVGTNDVIYKYVDEGTRSHIIMAGAYTGKSNKRVLAFRSGYKAKTKPKTISSSSGGSFGPMVFTPSVRHPGTKAREFSKTIQKKNSKSFKKAMQDAMVRGTKKAGHKI